MKDVTGIELLYYCDGSYLATEKLCITVIFDNLATENALYTVMLANLAAGNACITVMLPNVATEKALYYCDVP